jgi:hypothetical protein
MDKDTLGEMVLIPEDEFAMLEEDMEQMKQFIGFLMQALEDCGEDSMELEMDFLKSQDITEGDVH